MLSKIEDEAVIDFPLIGQAKQSQDGGKVLVLGFDLGDPDSNLCSATKSQPIQADHPSSCSPLLGLSDVTIAIFGSVVFVWH